MNKCTIPVSEKTSKILEHLKKRVADKSPNFMSALNSIGTEAVQVSYMFNEILNSFNRSNIYNTFFCNSHIEGVHGAIKIARHYMKDKDQSYDGKVSIFNPDGYYLNYLDQGYGEQANSVTPNLTIYSSWNNSLLNIADGTKIFLFSIENLSMLDIDKFDNLYGKKDVITILDLSRNYHNIQEELRNKIIMLFDIVVWGEVLTDLLLPFGAFSAKQEIYKIWNNVAYNSIHSTTYGGNGMVLSYVKISWNSFIPFSKRQRNINL